MWLTFKWLLFLVLIGGFLAGGAAIGYVSALVKDDPIRSKEEILSKIEENAVTGFAYFNDDTEIGQLRTEEDRRLVTLDEIPQTIVDAVLATEDEDFYDHIGVDVKSVFRAAKEKILNEDVQTGASTITQQLARRVFLNLDREMSRKVKEMLLALRIERTLSKDQILTAYLNKIPYGSGSSGYNVYGIKAAAMGIFGKEDLSQLNLAQSAYLAGLPQLPSLYSAFNSKGERDEEGLERAIKRQQLVLSRMLTVGKITEQQYQEALSFDIKGSLAEPQQKAYNTYPYLMIEVEKQATDVLLSVKQPDVYKNKDTDPKAYKNGVKDMQSELLRGGYKIYTTIDQPLYDAMQEIAKNDKNFFASKDPEKLEQVGAVMMDNKTGAILGMIEGRKTEYNHAMQATRQPGSTMKPIAAYLPALEKGLIQPAGILDDSPIILKDGSKGFHIPENWNTRFQGLVTAREALNQSLNIPAIKLFVNSVGTKDAWNFARQLGISTITKEDEGALTGVIGGMSKGVSVMEMTNAYTSIPSGGVFNKGYMIRKIEDPQGKVIYEHKLDPKQVYSEQTAYLMTDMLRTVITSGTGADIKSFFKNYGKIPVVGKTGSTQDDMDAWFMGYSPDITVGVWIGYDNPKYLLSKDNGTTRHAMKIWSLVMDDALKLRPELFPTKQFTKPNDIVEMTVSNVSGKLPSELTTSAGRTVTDLFNRKYVPTEVDDAMVRMKYVAYNGVNYIAQSDTPGDMVREKVVIKRPEPISDVIEKIKELMAKLPDKQQKPISRFIPKDADMEAPTQVDPRKDDGQSPQPPGNLVLTRSGETNGLSFSPSASSDVVGYRLYRTDGLTSFQRVNGKVILAGEDNVFPSLPYSYGSGYYVTAVDVAGHESSPSRIVFNDSVNPGLILNPGQTGAGNGLNGSGGDGAADRAPAAPKGLTGKLKNNSLRLDWSPGDDKEKPKQYIISYSEKEAGPFKKIGSTNGDTNFTVYSAQLEGYYHVTAVSGGKESAPSSAYRVRAQ
ncbi:penicillin-binding protein 1A [Paenibacillus sp. J31TS4]|uniref:penicillin-binding protein 1A n=1 Tax=Paenibacillus sp. J31TS4 TaxID=2807195 RepID=UPI0020BE8B69|nr:penicillin-binding protein 1A [Paenibacillus sp. J31TS4]